MLLDLRESVRNSKPIKYTVITLISIPFVLVGIGSYFSGGSAAPVAEINGEPIDPQQLENAYRQQRARLAQMFGGQIPEGFANESALRQQALQQLISQQVLESEVASQGFGVGDATLGRAIRNLPNFQVDGQFDSEAYQMQLRASGMSVPMFEQSFRDDTAINQFQTGISQTSFTLPQEVQRLSALDRQTRTIDAVVLDHAAAKEAQEVSDEEVTAYFEENSERYQFPERAKIAYIELNASQIAEDIGISDERAQAYYDENRDSYITPEQREASHILLDLEDATEEEQVAAINELRQRVEDGEVFADLAKERSDDIGSANQGGSLGVITPGLMVPAFEQAVFALSAEGDLSEPVVTDFGVHLIKLDRIVPESGQAFDDVKDDIVATLQQDEADREFFDLREQLIELTFDNSGSLEPASDATGLDIQESDWLDTETSAGPVLSNPSLLNAVFSAEVLDEGNNSDLIEVADRHVVVLRVLEHEGPRPQSIDDVREQIVESLKGEKANEQLTALADAASERLVAGDSASDIAEGEPLAEAYDQEVIGRRSALFDRSAIERVFSLSRPGDAPVTDTVTLPGGNQLVLRLYAVETPDAEAIDDAAEDAPTAAPASGAVPQAGVDTRRGSNEFNALMESLRERADIELASSVANP